jgi:hypothetical protein
MLVRARVCWRFWRTDFFALRQAPSVQISAHGPSNALSIMLNAFARAKSARFDSSSVTCSQTATAISQQTSLSAIRPGSSHHRPLQRIKDSSSDQLGILQSRSWTALRSSCLSSCSAPGPSSRTSTHACSCCTRTSLAHFLERVSSITAKNTVFVSRRFILFLLRQAAKSPTLFCAL